MFGLPRDIEEMKKVMVAQLGLDDVSSEAKEIPEDEISTDTEEFSDNDDSLEN